MVSVLTSRERKPQWGRARHKGIGKRYLDKSYRRGRRLERERRIGYVVEEGSEDGNVESLFEMIARIEGGNVESLIEMVSRYAHVE